MEYTTEMLKSVQKVELEILLKFDSICKKYNIRYQLFSGTLLGAIRHKGFIPWDDDIDVCMLRDDYEMFLRKCDIQDLGETFFLQTNITDPTSIIQFAKLRKNNTIFEPDNEVGSASHKGIYIDIFPLDNVKPYTKKGERQYKSFNFWYSIVTSSVKSRVLTASTLSKKIIRWFFYIITKIVPKQYIDKKIQKILKQFNNEKTEYVNHLSNGTTGIRPKRFLMKRAVFEDMINVEFEGHFFPAPRDYDSVLSQSYGDYMTLPPVEERKSHHGIVNLSL